MDIVMDGACGNAYMSLETSQYEIRKKLGIGLHSVNLAPQRYRWKEFRNPYVGTPFTTSAHS